MAIDRADWHYEGDFPKELPRENGGTHIGMFLAWMILNDLASQELNDDWPDEFAAVKARRLTGRAFLFKACDGKLWESDVNEEGSAFAAWYYSRESGYGPYIGEYIDTLAADLPSVYHVADSWANYDLIAPIISSAYAEWKAIQSRV